MSQACQAAWIHELAGHVLIDVVVSPRASRTRVLDVHDGRLKIQLAAPPVDGQANDALVRFIAAELEVARAQVEIVGGATSKRKTVRVSGVPAQRVLLKLLPNRG